MRDQMCTGDAVLFYHSNCAVPGIAGIARVSSTAYPDATQFDRNSKYFDPKATQETPRWFNVDVQWVKKIEHISLADLRRHPQLEGMRILQRGNRLSITPLDPAEWRFILKHLVRDLIWNGRSPISRWVHLLGYLVECSALAAEPFWSPFC